jgi:hypothetical protein
MNDELVEFEGPVEAAVRDYATWNHPAPHWNEAAGRRGAPAYWGRCAKKVYRTHDHAVADARSINRSQGRRDAASAYWCRRCRGYHVGRPVGTRYERRRSDPDLR